MCYRLGRFRFFMFWILETKNRIFQEKTKHLSVSIVILVAKKMLMICPVTGGSQAFVKD
jgi:hypothetical protein